MRGRRVKQPDGSIRWEPLVEDYYNYKSPNNYQNLDPGEKYKRKMLNEAIERDQVRRTSQYQRADELLAKVKRGAEYSLSGLSPAEIEYLRRQTETALVNENSLRLQQVQEEARLARERNEILQKGLVQMQQSQAATQKALRETELKLLEARTAREKADQATMDYQQRLIAADEKLIETKRELARYKPDPSDPRDWTALEEPSPIKPTFESGIVPFKTPVELNEAPVKPGKLDWFFERGYDNVAYAAGGVGFVGLFVAHLLIH